MTEEENWDTWESPNVASYPYQQQYHQTYSRTPTVNPNDLLIEIESRLAGTIIGKGGIKIKGLTKESGANIRVIDGNSYGFKNVKISGGAKAKEIAEKLINEIIFANDSVKMQQKSIDHQITSIDHQITSNPVEPVQSITSFDWDQLMIEQAENLKKKLAALPPIIKDFYKEQPKVSKMSDKEVADFRLSKNNIMVKHVDDSNDKPIPKPVVSFLHAFKDYPDILKEIQKQKFEVPSPVQCQAWPIIMSGHDLIAIAQTGTGKTLAFLLPAFIHTDLQTTPRTERKGPSVLVLAPTRELVLQIESEVKKYNYKGIKAMSIYGGVSSEKQKEYLRRGIEIVIATPGRLNDFVGNGAIDLSDVTFLILDEADRMLDLGFEPQIRVSLLKVRPDRQTIMTSATWPPGVKRLAKSYTTNPVQLIVGSLDLTTVNTVKQDILIMDEEDKEKWLDNFLRNITTEDKVIIFVNRKITVDQLSSDLIMKGHNVESIHGGREQSDREQSLDSLRNGEVSILIATDVASRGIDINDITVVINYDFTKDIEEYVHRVGRTGRAGKTGLAITLLTRKDWSKAKELVEVMDKSGQDIPPALQNMADRYKAKQEQDRAAGRNRSFRGGGRGFSSGGKRGFSINMRNNW